MKGLRKKEFTPIRSTFFCENLLAQLLYMFTNSLNSMKDTFFILNELGFDELNIVDINK